MGNENPALAMALAGIKGKKERALQMERPWGEIWWCGYGRFSLWDR
jgi:hypothetical protein